MRRSQNGHQNSSSMLTPSAFDDIDMAIEASPLFALGLCLDSSPLYYLAIAKRLQELHELADETEEAEYVANGSQNISPAGSHHQPKLSPMRPPSPPLSEPEETHITQSIAMESDFNADALREQEDSLKTYRMSSRTVDDFLRLLTGSGALRRNAIVAYDGDMEIDGFKTLQVALRFLGSQESLEELAQAFGFSEPATVRRLVQATLKAIVPVAPQLIIWPRKRDAARRQAESLFANSFGLDNTFGVMGWTLLDQFHNSVQGTDCKAILQATVDHRLRFVDTSCFFPPADEAVDLGAVFLESPIFKKLSSDTTRADWLAADSHILAPQLKSSHSAAQWLLGRYPPGSRSEGEQLLAEKAFNRNICHFANVTVREAFRHLLRRFPRISALSADYSDANDDIKTVVLAACVLHNFCIDRKEPLPPKSSSSQGTFNLSPILIKNDPSSLFTFSNRSSDDESSIINEKREDIAKAMTTQRSRSKRPRKSK